MPPFSNKNQLLSKTFLISQPNYNKNKRSSQCDYERKRKHSKCCCTCEKRRGLTAETPCFHFWDSPKPLEKIT